MSGKIEVVEVPVCRVDWKTLVSANVKVINIEDVDKIAKMCQEAEKNNENCSVWHNAAKFYGVNCPCMSCASK